MAESKLKLVFGGGSIDSRFGFDSPDKLQHFLDTLERLGIKTIDTAFIYGDSEELLGKQNAASRFVIDTKIPGGISPGSSTKENVIQIVNESLRRLNTKSIDILYQHAPDPEVPLEETLAGINELYQAGAFKRFGISNFNASDVEEVIRIAKAHDYVLPTVYQGNYNAIARRTETELFPVLRKHKIAFYAYSPSAGGFLAKTSDIFRDGGGTGRWDKDSQYGKIYHSLYNKASLLDALDTWNETAKANGISGIEMAYRWIARHSQLDATLGDAVIVGAGDVKQLQETVAWIEKGPLDNEMAKKIDSIWGGIASDTPLNNINSGA
ncbi:aldehyde reductase [Phlyctema vagabunda]|uniref:Aldehyde reductase n=1 Tax=Phlyctema vagabunda TaxID=108571 RepID=A0ABR4PPB1_9HELO